MPPDQSTSAIRAAISTLETLTYRDELGRRYIAIREDYDLNQEDSGNVQGTIDKLHAALAELEATNDV